MPEESPTYDVNDGLPEDAGESEFENEDSDGDWQWFVCLLRT